MTNPLRKKLDIPIDGSSNLKFTVADGRSTPALGKSKIRIEFIEDDLFVPVQVHIMESTNEELIIGNDVLKMRGAILDYTNDTLTLKSKNRRVKLPVNSLQEEVIYEESDEEYERQPIGEIFTSLGVEDEEEK